MTIRRLLSSSTFKYRKSWHYHAKASSEAASASRSPWAFAWHTTKYESAKHFTVGTPYCDFGYQEEKITDNLKDLAAAYYYGITVEELYKQ